MANTALVQLVAKGKLGTTQTFSWRETCAGPPSASQSQLDAWLASALVPTQNFITATNGPLSMMSSTDAFTSLNAYYLPAGTATAALASTTAMTNAGTGARILPYQCALVISQRTVIPGRSGRGRNYLPVSTSAVLSGGQLAGGVGTALATAAASWLTALAGLVLNGVNTTPVVASPLGSNTPAVVVKVVVDSIVDTQRRRRDKIGAVSVSTHSVP